MELSATQQAILDLIAERVEAEGVPPSQAEIARAFGFKGVRAAQYHLEALEAAGAIERMPGRARGIRVLRAPVPPQGSLTLAPGLPDAALSLPVLGRVAAGAPIGTDLDHDHQVILDRSLFSPMPDYLLRVHGDSMRGEGILDGDLIGVRAGRQARNGQVVVARVDDEITVKRLQASAQGVLLLPANPDYPAIEVGADQDFAIEGLYCGLVRPHR